ncbi:hypothetical protein J6590_087970 [Homalodisca vitripennis]|nr:hypothetical protein J6590_087970 [Homalodisca vitripennis]
MLLVNLKISGNIAEAENYHHCQVSVKIVKGDERRQGRQLNVVVKSVKTLGYHAVHFIGKVSLQNNNIKLVTDAWLSCRTFHRSGVQTLGYTAVHWRCRLSSQNNVIGLGTDAGLYCSTLEISVVFTGQCHWTRYRRWAILQYIGDVGCLHRTMSLD